MHQSAATISRRLLVGTHQPGPMHTPGRAHTAFVSPVAEISIPLASFHGLRTCEQITADVEALTCSAASRARCASFARKARPPRFGLGKAA